MMGKSSGHRNSEITAIYVGTTVITVSIYLRTPNEERKWNYRLQHGLMLKQTPKIDVVQPID